MNLLVDLKISLPITFYFIDTKSKHDVKISRMSVIMSVLLSNRNLIEITTPLTPFHA